MSEKLSAISIASTLAALCATSAIACGSAQMTTKSVDSPIAAREVTPAAPETEEIAEAPAPVAPVVKADEAEPQDAVPTGVETVPASMATAPSPDSAVASPAPARPAKKPEAKKTTAAKPKAAQGGCGAGTCG